jgi:hypothetical protein
MAATPQQVAASNSNISPAQRAANFNLLTRRHWKPLPPISVTENTDAPLITFLKVGLLSRVRLLVQGTMTVTHASLTTYTPALGGPFNLFRRVNLEINNGYNPFQLTGIGQYLLNLASEDRVSNIVPVYDTVANINASRAINKLANVSSTGGTADPFQCVIDMPLMINKRDPVGLVLAQNEQTIINVVLSLQASTNVLSAPTGYTVTTSSITVTPLIERFSVPSSQDAFPDISIIKLVWETNKYFAGAQDAYVDLNVGTTYRRLVIYITDSAGAAIADSGISGNFRFVFGDTATPIEIKPASLAAINSQEYGQPLPTGVWVLDLTDQGVINYGGSRDYIDTTALTEFQFNFQAPGACNVKVVCEAISKLKAS